MVVEVYWSKVHHLNCSTSDHSPLWIVTEGFKPIWYTKIFHFEEVFLFDKDYSETLKDVWANQVYVDC